MFVSYVSAVTCILYMSDTLWISLLPRNTAHTPDKPNKRSQVKSWQRAVPFLPEYLTKEVKYTWKPAVCSTDSNIVFNTSVLVLLCLRVINQTLSKIIKMPFWMHCFTTEICYKSSVVFPVAFASFSFLSSVLSFMVICVFRGRFVCFCSWWLICKWFKGLRMKQQDGARSNRTVGRDVGFTCSDT